MVLFFQLLVVELSDLDDRRGDAKRWPTPAGRGSHQFDLAPVTRERVVTAEKIHSAFEPLNSQETQSRL